MHRIEWLEMNNLVVAGAHPFDRERRIAVLPVVFVHQQRRPGVLQDVAQVAAGNVQG